MLVLDGLRFTEHPTHLSIPESIAAAKELAPKRTYLTHLNHDVLHAEAEAKLPETVGLAYDGQVFELDAHR